MPKKRKKKSGLGRIFLWILLGAGLLVGGYGVFQWWEKGQRHFVHYDRFGIDMPVNFAIHGIDVSKYQDAIRWESVRNMQIDDIKIRFAFIKATEGLGNQDSYFDRNWKKIKQAGLVRGAYHYFVATKSGKAQADNFIHSVNLEAGDLPPVLDIEQSFGVPGVKLRQRVLEWLQTIETYYGVIPIIYTSADFYNTHLKDEFDRYPLWVAHYLQPDQPRVYRNWIFWQHSEGGRVDGIYTRVDFNVFNGDSTQFSKLLLN